MRLATMVAVAALVAGSTPADPALAAGGGTHGAAVAGGSAPARSAGGGKQAATAVAGGSGSARGGSAAVEKASSVGPSANGGEGASAPAERKDGAHQPASEAPPARVEWSGRGRIEYQVSHKLHEVNGVCDEATGRMTVSGDTLVVEARARVDAFQSGNGNRDRHALQAIESDKFPVVEIRGTARGPSFPLAAAATMALRAKLDFHGVVVEQEIPVTLTPLAPDRLEARFEFPVSLEAHGIERPSLFTVKVADTMSIKGSMVLERTVSHAPSAAD